MARHSSHRRWILPTLMAAALVLASGTVSHAAPATGEQTVPPPAEQIGMEIAEANGSGCTPGTSRITVHPGNAAFDVAYDDFVARRGPGASPADARANCALAVMTTIPAGYSYGIAEVSHVGQASIPKGMTAQHRMSYYWCGCSGSFSFRNTLKGAFEGPVATRNTPDFVRFSPCSLRTEIVNLSSDVSLLPGSSTAGNSGEYSLGGPGGVAATYSLVWRACA